MNNQPTDFLILMVGKSDSDDDDDGRIKTKAHVAEDIEPDTGNIYLLYEIRILIKIGSQRNRTDK